jgi:hypothetical protein
MAALDAAGIRRIPLSTSAVAGRQPVVRHRSRAAPSRRVSGSAARRSLIVIDAADHRLLCGPAIYDLFVDRSRRPELIRTGYERTSRALDAVRRTRRGRAGGVSALDCVKTAPDPRCQADGVWRGGP